MPYKDIEKQREYNREKQRLRRAKRRTGRPPLSGKRSADPPPTAKRMKELPFNLETLDDARRLLRLNLEGKHALSSDQLAACRMLIDTWRKDGSHETDQAVSRMMVDIKPLPLHCPSCGKSFEA